LNSSQIFRLNGFEPKDFDGPEAERMLKLLIKQSEDLNGYTSDCKEHPSEPRLNLYFYVHNQGIKKSEGSSETNNFSSTSAVNKSLAKSIQDAAGDPAIKFENEHILKVKEQSVVVNSGKKTLQGLISQLADLVADLKAKKVENTKGLTEEVNLALAEATNFVGSLRDIAARASLADLHYVDEAEELANEMALTIQKTLVHTEGLKLKIKQVRTFL
jgi:hypothetical protein